MPCVKGPSFPGPHGLVIGRSLRQQSVHLAGERVGKIISVGKLDPDEVKPAADIVDERVVGVGMRRDQEGFPALNRASNSGNELGRNQLHRGDLVDDNEGDGWIGYGVQDGRDTDRIEVGKANTVPSDLGPNGLMDVGQGSGTAGCHIGDREAHPMTALADLGCHHPAHPGAKSRNRIEDQRGLAHSRATCENDTVVVHILFPLYPL